MNAARAPLAVLASLAAALSACGGVTTPDLRAGEVSGRLTGADPARAQVYVLGDPASRASVAADGSYTLAGVPAGTARIVLFDGRDRAEVRTVEVRGATRNHAGDRAAVDMPLAGRVVVVPRCAGGARGDAAALEVDGTVVRGAPVDGGAIELWPLPAGEFVLRGKLKGFKGSDRPVQVRSGAEEPVELPFELDSGDDRGCRSNPCAAGLACGDDGVCRECDADADCGGGTCDQHVCVAPAAAARGACEPCTAHEQCGAGGVCLSIGGGAGLCAPAAAAGHCPAGYAAAPSGGGAVCVPPEHLDGRGILDACTRLRIAFGYPCLRDAGCAQILAGGACLKPSGAKAGTCTAACAADADCPAALGRCDPALHVCVGS